MARKKVATKKEKEWMSKVQSLDCLICERPANIHHCRNYGTGNVGMGNRSSSYHVLPLCYDHHQGQFSIHNNKKAFEKKYGTEKELLEIVKRRLKSL